MAKFETFRNRQPLIDHRLIADAEASRSAPGVLLLHHDPILGAGVAALPRRRRGPGPCRRCRRVPYLDARREVWTLCCRGWPRCNATVR